MAEIISDPGAIGADWLTEVLRDAGALPSGRVSGLTWQTIGHGKLGDNVRYALEYEAAPETAPSSVVAKLPAADPTSRASSAAQGFYRREVCFYREIAPRIPMRTPAIYTALVHENGTDYVILMEDLSPARPGDQIEGCDVDRAELAIREAAKLHGPLFEDQRLAEFDWVFQNTPEGSQLGQAILQVMWPQFCERFTSLTPEARAMGDQFVGAFANWANQYAGPRSLVHADYRLENLLFGNAEGGPPIAVVDWQSIQYGCPLADVAYFLGGGLSIEDRRAHERELVELYRGEMARAGVELDSEYCWKEYRRCSLHGILITVLGCMLSGQDERGDRMFAAMIERHLQHGVDLGADEFLR